MMSGFGSMRMHFAGELLTKWFSFGVFFFLFSFLWFQRVLKLEESEWVQVPQFIPSS